MTIATVAIACFGFFDFLSKLCCDRSDADLFIFCVRRALAGERLRLLLSHDLHLSLQAR